MPLIPRFKLLVFLLTLVISSSDDIRAQESNYTPITNYKIHKDTITSILKKIKAPAYSHKLEQKKAITKFQEICLERSNYLKGLNTEGLVMTGDTVTNWVNGILKKLIDANPILQESNYKVFTHRSSICNAYNIGEGVILINLGLLARITNEEELAFVLAHELGHDILKHVMESTAKQSALYGDKEFLKKLKNASKQEYGATTEIERLLLTLMSNKMLHSRGNEFLADSLGFEISNRAAYDASGAYGLLEILDSSDYFLYNHDVDLKTSLTTKHYNLKDEWFSAKDLDPMWERDENLFSYPDSLKTHPGCQDRIGRIDKIVSSKDVKNRTKSTSYSSIDRVVKFELLQSLIEEGGAVEAMYYSLEFLKNEPDNTYLYCTIANALIEIRDALINMEFRWYVSFPDKSFPKGYNKTLSFFHNMNSRKLESIFNAYFLANISERESDSFVEYLNFRHQHLAGKIDQEKIDEYVNKIENEYFKNKIENLKLN